MTTTISSSYGLSPPLNPIPDLTTAEYQTNEIPVNESASQSVDLVKMRVIHATTGRLRILTIDGSWNSQIENLSQGLKQQIWVTEILANASRGSLIIKFDHHQVSLPQVLEFLAEFNVEYSSATVRTYLSHLHQWKSFNFWKSQASNFIPLLIGFALTKGFRVRGWLAIIIYMLAADTTRWLMSLASTPTDEQVESTLVKTNKVGKETHSDVTELSANLNYKIVHQIVGRIRFHIPQIAQEPAYVQRLEQLLKADDDVTNVRINFQASSVIIIYHNPDTNIHHWIQLMELALQPEIQTTSIHSKQITPPETLIPSQETEELTTLNLPTNLPILSLSSLWVDLKPAMISYSLAVMAKFPF